jgi:hypothetical protein
MTAPPSDITAVSVIRHGVLHLTFADGLMGEVDVLPRMWGSVFEQARTPEGFAKVTVGEDTGTVVWAGEQTLRPTRSTSASAPAFGQITTSPLRDTDSAGPNRVTCSPLFSSGRSDD